MTVVRHYIMTAIDGRGHELLAALQAIGTSVTLMPGCGGVEILRDIDVPDRFVLMERWDSVEAHQQCLSKLPQDLVDSLLAPLAEPLEGVYLRRA